MESILPSIVSFFKDSVFGSLSSFNLTSLLGKSSFFAGILDFIKQFGGDTNTQVNQGLTDLNNGLSNALSGFLQTVTPDAKLAKSTIELSINDNPIYAACKDLGLDDAAIAQIKKYALDANQTFWSSAHPALDNGRPELAVNTSNALFSTLQTYLTGGGNHVGPLMAAHPDWSQDKLIEQAQAKIIIPLTGVKGDGSMSSAINLPDNGLVSAWGRAQLKLNDPHFKENSLVASDVAPRFDLTGVPGTMPPIDKTALAGNTITGGTDVNHPGAAPAGPRPAQQVSLS